MSDHVYSPYLCAIFQYEHSLQPINLTNDDLKIQVKQIYDWWEKKSVKWHDGQNHQVSCSDDFSGWLSHEQALQIIADYQTCSTDFHWEVFSRFLFKGTRSRNFPGGPVVDSGLPLQGEQVPSLVPHDPTFLVAWPKNLKIKEKGQSWPTSWTMSVFWWASSPSYFHILFSVLSQDLVAQTVRVIEAVPWGRHNTGLGCCALLQGTVLNQRRNPHLLHRRWILHHLSCQRSPHRRGGNNSNNRIFIWP